MKRTLLIYLCLMCMLVNLFAFSVSAEPSGGCGDNAKWSLSDDGVLTISGFGAIRDYLYDGYGAWPNIKAPWRSYGSKIKKVVINPGITRIGDNAFCRLPKVTSVSIPPTVKSIGQAAFCDMSALTQITLPQSVVEMETDVFLRCSSLETAKLPSGLKTLPGGMFEGCTALKSIDFPKELTTIGALAFKSSGLTSLVIPEGVTIIGTSAFQYCGNLTTVELPSSLTEIGFYAFKNSGITSIVFPANVKTIGRSFPGCNNLKSICFEGNAPAIDVYAFEFVTATVYYPKGNRTWAESVRRDYLGQLTWVTSCGDEHTWGQWKTEKEATCSEAGLEKRSCPQCGLTEEKIIAKTAHQYEPAVTPPTCQDKSPTMHTCKVCKDIYERPAGIHAFGEWVVIKKATCLEKGSRQHSCTTCDLQETEEIELSGHTYRNEVTAPSCTQEGFTTHVCTVCEDTFIDTYTAIREHTYGDWTETKPATWWKEGEQSRQCVHCAEKQTEVLPELPINAGLVIGSIVAVVAVIAGSIVAIVVIKKKRHIQISETKQL